MIYEKEIKFDEEKNLVCIEKRTFFLCFDIANGLQCQYAHTPTEDFLVFCSRDSFTDCPHW
jgi:hypothetical protein